ncbi:hypothetical protein MNO14_13755 [Luteimonas sp. S4-F44]|uniref:hypothetical protein n=1 Tax=Luteimonas sp. S4-F44 TaxID=2925842 RepID=UPI001F52C229|nr:hypothetical protein [Luteimonas sp. S4-F44]UNK42004.1 hypothetical protein MNO14_13755 [Luteimonas sp. S4-F44]
MNEVVETARADTLSGGDWLMAVVSFFLTPIAPLGLAIYNFAKGRKPQGLLYLGVIGAQVLLVAVRVASM